MSRSLLLTFVAAAAVPNAVPIFRDLPSQESGVSWIHHNGFSQNHYLPESTGPGVAIFDYNNDGLMDILLVDSGTSVFYKPDVPLHPVLYRNNGNGTYTDVSKDAALSADFYGQGVAVGDYDGDGYEDVFISGFGNCVLYHNNGNGTFSDVTAGSGAVISGLFLPKRLTRVPASEPVALPASASHWRDWRWK